MAVRVWGIFARTSVIVFSQKWNEKCEELWNSKTLGKSKKSEISKDKNFEKVKNIR